MSLLCLLCGRRIRATVVVVITTEVNYWTGFLGLSRVIEIRHRRSFVDGLLGRGDHRRARVQLLIDHLTDLVAESIQDPTIRAGL